MACATCVSRVPPRTSTEAQAGEHRDMARRSSSAGRRSREAPSRRSSVRELAGELRLAAFSDESESERAAAVERHSGTLQVSVPRFVADLPRRRALGRPKRLRRSSSAANGSARRSGTRRRSTPGASVEAERSRPRGDRCIGRTSAGSRARTHRLRGTRQRCHVDRSVEVAADSRPSRSRWRCAMERAQACAVAYVTLGGARRSLPRTVLPDFARQPSDVSRRRAVERQRATRLDGDIAHRPRSDRLETSVPLSERA